MEQFESLKGCVVIITGGSMGIGKASAIRFFEQGSNVIIGVSYC